MTTSAGSAERGESRRAANARKRVSRRPSRLGVPAGATTEPDHLRPADAGFPGLLHRAWQAAEQAGDLHAAIKALLTLDGHVPADVQLRALSTSDEAAVKALFGLTWRDQDTPHGTAGADDAAVSGAGEEDDGEPVFVGELALTTSGRIVLRTPAQGPLPRSGLAGGVLRVPWSRADLRAYQREMSRAAARLADTVADCRDWLAGQGADGRDALLEQAKEAALRTAPFVLYQEHNQYTNFREQNTLTGKTLWPGHPDCALSSLQGVPLELWSDNDVQLLVCLTLLIASAGFGRVEEANGTQLTVDHVAFMLERVRRGYTAVLPAPAIPAARTARVADLHTLAAALREHRTAVGACAQLYREIHGALMHKIERVAAPAGDLAQAAEEAICAALREDLPLTGTTLDALGAGLAADAGWLARPHGAYGTGLEALVHATVAAAATTFAADFAMSRGMRFLPELISALRAGEWARICDWDITRYFCCVVPGPGAAAHFGDSLPAVADTAWAMSSRMQYNSWHFVPGNLPRDEAVIARDHFVPPTIPDIAFHSDQHHHGHVNNKVRFSIRSPQAVTVDGRRFNGFIDLRLLRCQGPPFTEQDLLAAHRVSAFLAAATGAAADLAAAGEPVEVTAFDSAWHWRTVTGTPTRDTPARGTSAAAASGAAPRGQARRG